MLYPVGVTEENWHVSGEDIRSVRATNPVIMLFPSHPLARSRGHGAHRTALVGPCGFAPWRLQAASAFSKTCTQFTGTRLTAEERDARGEGPLSVRSEDKCVILERLRLAQQYLDDAQYLLAADRRGSAVSRAYYAAYQAMWAALGDPPRGEGWRHGAILNHFVRGYWFAPAHPATGPAYG
jgi:hypothetical protein